MLVQKRGDVSTVGPEASENAAAVSRSPFSAGPTETRRLLTATLPRGTSGTSFKASPLGCLYTKIPCLDSKSLLEMEREDVPDSFL